MARMYWIGSTPMGITGMYQVIHQGLTSGVTWETFIQEQYDCEDFNNPINWYTCPVGNLADLAAFEGLTLCTPSPSYSIAWSTNLLGDQNPGATMVKDSKSISDMFKTNFVGAEAEYLIPANRAPYGGDEVFFSSKIEMPTRLHPRCGQRFMKYDTFAGWTGLQAGETLGFFNGYIPPISAGLVGEKVIPYGLTGKTCSVSSKFTPVYNDNWEIVENHYSVPPRIARFGWNILSSCTHGGALVLHPHGYTAVSNDHINNFNNIRGVTGWKFLGYTGSRKCYNIGWKAGVSLAIMNNMGTTGSPAGATVNQGSTFSGKARVYISTGATGYTLSLYGPTANHANNSGATWNGYINNPNLSHPIFYPQGQRTLNSITAETGQTGTTLVNILNNAWLTKQGTSVTQVYPDKWHSANIWSAIYSPLTSLKVSIGKSGFLQNPLLQMAWSAGGIGDLGVTFESNGLPAQNSTWPNSTTPGWAWSSSPQAFGRFNSNFETDALFWQVGVVQNHQDSDFTGINGMQRIPLPGGVSGGIPPETRLLLSGDDMRVSSFNLHCLSNGVNQIWQTDSPGATGSLATVINNGTETVRENSWRPRNFEDFPSANFPNAAGVEWRKDAITRYNGIIGGHYPNDNLIQTGRTYTWASRTNEELVNRQNNHLFFYNNKNNLGSLFNLSESLVPYSNINLYATKPVINSAYQIASNRFCWGQQGLQVSLSSATPWIVGDAVASVEHRTGFGVVNFGDPQHHTKFIGMGVVGVDKVGSSTSQQYSHTNNKLNRFIYEGSDYDTFELPAMGTAVAPLQSWWRKSSPGNSIWAKYPGVTNGQLYDWSTMNQLSQNFKPFDESDEYPRNQMFYINHDKIAPQYSSAHQGCGFGGNMDFFGSIKIKGPTKISSLIIRGKPTKTTVDKSVSCSYMDISVSGSINKGEALRPKHMPLFTQIKCSVSGTTFASPVGTTMAPVVMLTGDVGVNSNFRGIIITPTVSTTQSHYTHDGYVNILPQVELSCTEQESLYYNPVGYSGGTGTQGTHSAFTLFENDLSSYWVQSGISNGIFTGQSWSANSTIFPIGIVPYSISSVGKVLLNDVVLKSNRFEINSKYEENSSYKSLSVKKVALRDESVFDLRLKDSTGTPVNTGEATNTKIFRPPVMQGGTLIDGLTGAEGVSILSDYCTFFAPQDSTIVW